MYQLKIAPTITNREGEALERYLQDIGRAEMISPEEEVELSMRIQRGDRLALSRLVNANLRFVVSVANNIRAKGSDSLTSSTREMSDSSKQRNVLTPHEGSNLFPMLFGGFAKVSCKQSRKKVASCAYPAIRKD